MKPSTRRARLVVATAVMTCAAILVPTMARASGSNTPAAPVPAGFKANAITWLSPQRGWILGNAACGSHTCTDVLGTADGAATWHLFGMIKAPIPTMGNAGFGVTEVRFSTPNIGWAFAPDLFRTTDGGRSWTSMAIPGGGKQVLYLAANTRSAYAVVSPCRWGLGICSHDPLTLWRTTSLTGGSWTQIPLDLPISVAADIAVYGRTVYVLDPQTDSPSDRFYASTDGIHFSARPVPCTDPQDTDLIQAVPTSATDVALLCDGNPGFSKAVKTVYRSTDTGHTDTSAGTMGLYGIQAQLAASPSGNLAVESWSDGSFIYINDTGGTTWTQVIGSGDGGAGWNDIVYVTDQEAWVVFGPTELFADYGVVYVTHDAGQTWEPVTL